MRALGAGVIALLLVLASCDRAAEHTKNVLNKGGEFAGSAATEVIEGVTTGVEHTWSVDVRLSDELKVKGLAVGQVQLESDSTGRDNRLIVYFSSEHMITDTLTATAFDQDGVEMGRAQLLLNLAAGSADYQTFTFQSRTDLERKSRVEVR